MITALFVARNEEDLVNLSVSAVLPYVDEVIFVDNESEDGTVANLPKSDKVKIFRYPKEEVLDMGRLRSFALSKVTQPWFIAVDCDEIYPPESMQKIVDFINNPGEAISARVRYSNIAWRCGFKQDNFDHAPDRIYKTEVVDCCSDVLPLDMWKVKKEHLDFPNKRKGSIGPLEYDSEDDKSIEHRKQPILDAWYYHLARARGYNFEYRKNVKYQHNIHPEWTEEECRNTAKQNQWVTGLYDMRPIEVPIKTSIINPKVSIIITNFQYKQYVGEAIESCLNQTVKPFEIIVVDDHSHDDSISTIRQYPVTAVARDHNGGTACARNDGIARSTGDYFICLDADDCLAPTFIEETLKGIGENEICYTDLEFFGNQTGINNYPEFNSDLLRGAQIIPSCCALIKRQVFEASGGFDPNQIYEDFAFWLRLDQIGMRFKHIAKPLFRYRVHGVSRIDHLDSQMEEGLKRLSIFNVTAKINTNRINEAKSVLGI